MIVDMRKMIGLLWGYGFAKGGEIIEEGNEHIIKPNFKYVMARIKDIEVKVLKAKIELPEYCHISQINGDCIPVTLDHNTACIIGRSYEYCYGTNTLKVAIVGQHLEAGAINFGIAGPVHKSHTEIIGGKEVTVIDEMTLHSVSVICQAVGVKHKLI